MVNVNATKSRKVIKRVIAFFTLVVVTFTLVYKGTLVSKVTFLSCFKVDVNVGLLTDKKRDLGNNSLLRLHIRDIVVLICVLLTATTILLRFSLTRLVKSKSRSIVESTLAVLRRITIVASALAARL